jgi:hypothetical protein
VLLPQSVVLLEQPEKYLFTDCTLKYILKGLSHEIDFKNFDKNLYIELGLKKGSQLTFKIA